MNRDNCENNGWMMAEEDRDSIKEGLSYAEANAEKFCQTHADELLDLMAAYSDAEAEALFWNLRTEFWARIWEPSDK